MLKSPCRRLYCCPCSHSSLHPDSPFLRASCTFCLISFPQTPWYKLPIPASLLQLDCLLPQGKTKSGIASLLGPRKLSNDFVGRTAFDADHRYLFNPFTIGTCIGRPTSVFTNFAILWAIAKAVNGKPLSSMFALALAAYLSLYPALLLPPILLLCYDQTRVAGKLPSFPLNFFLNHISIFSASIAWLLYISYLLTGGSWEFLSSTYGVHLLLPDLTPNVGLWWYFFIEMFDSFREFFLSVFWLHLGGYVGALCIRIRPQPLFVVTSLLGIFAIFKPYPSISDTSLYFALLPLYRHIMPCEYSIRE